MADYWKSTPKYYCSHCKQYVRDTPLEKTNHEASPRHQGNLKRFVRDLHRQNERSEREKQRAKDEVARLNGERRGDAGGPLMTRNAPPASQSKQSAPASGNERKRQMAQLAEMGVVVPEDFRKENAMVGDWETVPQRVRTLGDKQSASGATEQSSIGIRKRKVEDDDDNETGQVREGKPKRQWGSDVKNLAGGSDQDDDLDALLRQHGSIPLKDRIDPPQIDLKPEPVDAKVDVPVKSEEDEKDNVKESSPAVKSEVGIEKREDGGEEEASELRSIFKKRRPKAAR